MSFDPQIPSWGKSFLAKNLDNLTTYHNWLKNTGVQTGLISPKNDQFIWDEFIVHSLYFYKIIFDLKNVSEVTCRQTSKCLIFKDFFSQFLIESVF